MITTANRLNRIEEYYFSHKLREVRRLAASGRDIINLGIGNPDLPPSENTLAQLADTAQQAGSHGYQPYRGTATLRDAMAGWYKRTYGVSLDAQDELLPLMGSKEGIFHISMAFLDEGDHVLVPDPGYPGYAGAARLTGAKIINYNLIEANGWLPDLEALAQQDLSRVKIMWLNYPHMPTGALANRSFFEQLVDFGRKHHILLCHDNPYSQILNPDNPLSILLVPGAKTCCIELNSLSKSHNMAGWRVGMMAGNKQFIDAALTVKSNLDSGMFLGTQHAAVAALQNPTEWHHTQNEIYRERRELVYRLLDSLAFNYSKENTAGMFVWARVPESIENVETFLDEILYGADVFITPGKVFGKNGERYVRISVCQPKEIIQKAAERIEAFTNKRKIAV